jgi:hypothetical protein
MKRFWLGLLIVLILGTLTSCSGTRMLMQQAPKTPKNLSFSLPLLESNEAMLANLEQTIFGPIPTLRNVEIIKRTPVAENTFTKGDRVDEWKVSAGYGAERKIFHIVLITHNDQPNAPFIISQNFCPNISTVPIDGLTPPSGSYFDCSGEGMAASFFGYFFGRYITVPPYEMILNRGYNIAMIYPPEFVPDNKETAPMAIEQLFGNQTDKPGALAIWASLTTWLAEELKTNMVPEHVIAYGHSRYGKTALLAGAMSENIDAVIAHQSGTGGASLLRDGTGESIESIMENYPHWFRAEFKKFANNKQSLPIDAHSLLALLAPKPIMLGNARRDVWSDPEGAFYAAQAANSAWNVHGSRGLTAKRLDEFRPEDDIAFWMRSGTHGVVEEDWPAFLYFLDAHFVK